MSVAWLLHTSPSAPILAVYRTSPQYVVQNRATAGAQHGTAGAITVGLALRRGRSQCRPRRWRLCRRVFPSARCPVKFELAQRLHPPSIVISTTVFLSFTRRLQCGACSPQSPLYGSRGNCEANMWGVGEQQRWLFAGRCWGSSANEAVATATPYLDHPRCPWRSLSLEGRHTGPPRFGGRNGRDLRVPGFKSGVIARMMLGASPAAPGAVESLSAKPDALEDGWARAT